MFAPWKESYDKPRQHIKKERHHFADKDLCSQSYGFSSRHAQKRELEHKQGWALKNGCFQMVMLEETLQSPLNLKETKQVNPKGNQTWIVTRRTDAEAKAPILWSPDVKNWLIGKDSDAGKDWRQEEKRVTEHDMVGWHRWLEGHEFEQTPGESGGQRNLECYSPCSHRVRHDLVTEQQRQIDFISYYLR